MSTILNIPKECNQHSHTREPDLTRVSILSWLPFKKENMTGTTTGPFHPLPLQVCATTVGSNRVPLPPGPSTALWWLHSSECCHAQFTCNVGCQGEDHGKLRRPSLDADAVVGARTQVQAHLRSLAAGSHIKGHFLGKFLLIPSLALNVELKQRGSLGEWWAWKAPDAWVLSLFQEPSCPDSRVPSESETEQ